MFHSCLHRSRCGIDSPNLRASSRHRCSSSSSKRHTTCRAQKKEQDQDLVTKWVGKIFGQKAIDDPNPGGLKRMDWSKVKDLEVILDKDAAPRASDDPYMKMIRPMLSGTSLEEEDLRCAYSAVEDGWTPADFHSRVGGYGSCILLARTKGGAVCGGYNPLGFDGFGSDKGSMGAFLFTWPTGDTKNSRPVKLPKIGTETLAVIDRMDQGPQWASDLKVPLKNPQPTQAKCKLVDYARLPGSGKQSKTIFSAEEGGKAELVELRAYVRKGGKLNYELDGLKWVTSYKEGGDGPPIGIVSL